MRIRFLSTLILFASFPLLPGSAPAQTPSSVHGTVADPAGNPVAAAPVTLTPRNHTQPPQHTLSSTQGEFTFTNLPPGRYDVSIPPYQGFDAAHHSIDVRSTNATLNFKLIPAAVSETVNVGAEQTLSTESSDNQDAISLSSSALNNLPIFDQDLVGALTPFLDPSATSTSGVSLIVDGVEVQKIPVSASGIAEIKINSDPYSAEFASPGRGRIEITTKPGSPQFHGELNFLFRDSALNAKNYFAPVRPPEQRTIIEGHLTGPVGHTGHTTFLLSGDRRDDRVQSSIHAFGVNGLIEENAPTPSANNEISGRMTHDFSDAHRLAVAYQFWYDTDTNLGVGGLVLPGAGSNQTERGDQITFNDRIILSPTLIQQAMIVLERQDNTTASTTQAQSIQVQDAFTSGGAQADLHRSENTIHISDVVTWTHKHHYIRFGANIPQISRRAEDDHTNRLGTFSFSSLAAFQSSTPSQFTVQQGPGRGLYWINEIGSFFQDEIAVRPSLHVTLGVRYQWQTYLSDLDCFAPRMSFAWQAGKHWVLRGGSGIFYDRTGGDFPIIFKTHNGIALQQYQVINPGYPNPLPPGQILTSLPTGLVREDANLRAPYQVQYSATIEHSFAGLTATADYRGITGVDSFRSRDANAPLAPTYATSPNPNLGFVQQIESGGRTRSNAFDLALRGKAGKWFAGQAQYIFSHNNANTGGIRWFPQNQYLPNAEWGRTDQDRHHRFNFLGTLHPGHWLSLGVGATLYSGAPYSQLAGADLYNTGLSNARPTGVARNTLQGAGTTDIDLNWAHDFHLSHAHPNDEKLIHFSLSAFNIFNHSNFSNYVGSINSPLYQQPTTAASARQMQFNLGYQF